MQRRTHAHTRHRHVFLWDVQKVGNKLYAYTKQEEEGDHTNQALTVCESPARPCAFPACRPNTGRQ